MKNILHDLYFGNIQPLNGQFINHNTYQQVLDKVTDAQSELLSALGAQQTALYHDLVSLNCEKDIFEDAQIYASGFILGAQIMLACLSKSGDEV